MNLFSDYQLGDLTLANRVVMAPMTRSRAVEGNVVNPLTAVYYAQRAAAGLLITEGSQISPQGLGYVRTPGIHSNEQVEGWRKVTTKVHEAGGKIFLQLWHVGRISHPDFHGGELPVAPSALAAEGEVFTPSGPQKIVTPRALEVGEIPEIVKQFEAGAANAKAAGFDGVEIHGANGYLLDQFLRDGSNHRTDTYGGSIENRARLALEVTDAVLNVWPPERVGYRISPHNQLHSMSDSEPERTFSYLAGELSRVGVGYLHVVEPVGGFTGAIPKASRLAPRLRQLFQGTLIVNGGYDKAGANEAISGGEADLVAFGVPFIANPDLVRRFELDAPLNQADSSTFYAGEEKGYIDYPALP